jgi:hypothetical protein
VLGQTIKVNAGTSFGKGITGANITGLMMGDFIHVDGFIDSNGDIVATRIELGSASDTLQVLGSVAGLDSINKKFMINKLTVDYASANLSGFMSGAPADGDLVEVQGTSFNSTTTTLTATQVTRQMSDEEEAGNANDELDREGLITSVTSATNFEVNGEKVTTTPSTEFRNGTAADLLPNVKVEVEGTLDSNSVLVAAVVTFEHNGNIELEAQAMDVNATAGTLTLLGVPVTVTTSTRFEDESSAAVAIFNLSNVNPGDTIKVHGYESPAGSGKVVAMRLERLEPSTSVLVEGPFTASGTSMTQFMVLGITIDASSATFSDGQGGTLSATQFFAQAPGHDVEVHGAWSGTVVTASDVAINDHSGDEN